MAILVLLVAAPLAGEEPPAAPDGFVWKKIDSVKAAFLLPKGWYFKEEEKDGAYGIFISKENIDTAGEFETGMSVHVQRLKKDPAPDRAALLIMQLSEGNEVQRTWRTEQGVLKLFGARIRVTVDPPTFIEHVLAIGNSRTNTLYFIRFESPEANWNEAWKTGDVMLQDFLLDDEY
jgi:hypothetical protein